MTRRMLHLLSSRVFWHRLNQVVLDKHQLNGNLKFHFNLRLLFTDSLSVLTSDGGGVA